MQLINTSKSGASGLNWQFKDQKIMPVKLIILSIIASLLCTDTKAQNNINLSQAINSAWANRKNIQAGKLDISIRKLQTAALLKKYWPQLSFEYNYLFNPILQTSILPIGIFNPSFPIDATKAIQFGTKWSQSADLTLMQPLIDQTVKSQLKESALQEKITSASQAQTEYELAYTVAKAYLDICVQERQIQVATADTARTWISYKLLKDKFDSQRLLKSELNKAKVNHNNTLQKLKDAVSQLVEDKVYLLFLIGRPDIEKADFTVDTNFYKPGRDLKKALLFQKDSIPELQQLELQGKLSGLQVQSEKAKYIPSLNLKGHLGANQYTNNFNPVEPYSWFGSSYIGINMKLPLLFGEDKQSKIQQLHQQEIQFNQQKEDKSAQYAKDAFTANLKYERVMEQIQTLGENIELQKETLVILHERVLEGQETASALNTQEVELQSTEAQKATAEQQLSLYWLDYLKAMGQLRILWN